jgi:hypothetical protein
LKQVLHIFRKDFRHHWPEILVSLFVLIAFTVEQPRDWTGLPLEGRFLNGFVHALPPLMILAWAFLIVRLVQGESLVGDRQFWITRPYRWHKLLAAKFLCILLSIHFPLFVTQLVLLKIAHFPVVSSIPGILYVHLLFLSAIVLPSLTLGSITSGIGQASLVLLALFLLLLGLLFIFMNKPEMDLTDATDTPLGSIYLCICVTAILIQYIHRKTLFSRLVVACGVASVVLVIALAPYGKLITRDFPLATKEHPVPAEFTLDRTLSFGHAEGQRLNFYGDEVELEIPFQVAKLADKTIVQIRAIKLDIDLPNGEHWTSHWHSLYHVVSPGRTREWPTINIKREEFNRLKNSPVRTHASLGFNVYRLGLGTEIFLAGDHLSLPGGAWCLNQPFPRSLKCFAALKHPGPLFVIAELPSVACPVSKEATNDPWAASPANFADLGGDSTPSLDFTPIQQFNVSLSRFNVFEDHEIGLPICPETPLFVSKPEFRYRVRDEIDLGEVTLLNYVPTYPRQIVPPIRRYTPGASTQSFRLPFGRKENARTVAIPAGRRERGSTAREQDRTRCRTYGAVGFLCDDSQRLRTGLKFCVAPTGARRIPPTKKRSAEG